MHTVRLFERFLLLSLHDNAVTVATHGLYKDVVSVLRGKPPSEICVVDESRRKNRTDHPSLSASFYHSNSGLLIEVEEDNDRIYSSTHLSFLSLSLSVSLSILTLSPSLTLHPIHTARESLSDDPRYSFTCVCVCMCVSMRLISSGLAGLTW